MRFNWPFVAGSALLLGGALVYWFATGGIPRGSDGREWLTSAPIAHRGFFSVDGTRPENSLPAFRAAVSAGYPVELDVRLTSDGGVVVIHDEDLLRVAGDPRRVSDLQLSELRELRLLGGEERVPTLADALAEIDGRVPVVVEIKNKQSAGALEEKVAEQVEAYSGELAVISFNPYSLAYFAKRMPSVPRGQLSGTFEGEGLPFYQRIVLRELLMNWTSKPHFIAYELEALPSWRTSLQRRRGRELLAWTATERANAQAARAFADNVICDPGALEPTSSAVP